ncbi:MAG: hypothetical protein ABR881_10995 [Candidatus Sulfotelmatobacter sp.]
MNNVSGALSPHGGQRSLRHRDRAEKIRLELQPQFVDFDIFRESGHGESRIVDQNVQPSVIADYTLDETLDGVKYRTPVAAIAWSSRSRRPRLRMVATTRNPAFASSMDVSNPKSLEAPLTSAVFSGIAMV